MVATGCAAASIAPQSGPPAASAVQPRTRCAGATEIPNSGGGDAALPRLCVAPASLSQRGIRQRGSWSNDDRVRVTHGGLLLAVGDGSGLPIGGDHAPIGLESGLDALEHALRPALKEAPCTEACVIAAFERANAAMYAFQAAFKPIFDEELSKTRDDRAGAERRAWHRVARAYFGFVSETAVVTVSASVTALVFDGRYATIGQVGTTRAYRCRSGNLELLLPDQSQNPDARLGDDGNPSYGLATARLGLGPTATVLTRSVEVLPADRFILVSDGVWSVVPAASIAQACTLATASAISAALASAAHTALDDLTIAVAIVSAAGID